MSTSNGFTIGERVVVLPSGKMTREMQGTVAAPMPGRVSYEDSVWVQLDRTVLGMSVIQPHVDRVRRDEQHRAERTEETIPGFAPLLREYRDRRRLSQSRLAEAAGFDHSYVSRLESGTRMPTRDAVSKLADAMGLHEGERDALLASAGFLPSDVNNLFANEPVIGEVLTLLANREISAEVRDDIRAGISVLVRQARRTVLASGSQK